MTGIKQDKKEMETKTSYRIGTSLRRNMGLFALAALLLSSCVKDELHNTPHPDHGKVAVTADWANRGENIPVPEKWTVSIGDYTGEETAATHAPDYLFEPGGYTLAAYNEPEGVTINGTAAAADTDPDNAGCITGQPGRLFTSVQTVAIEADRDHAFTASMRPQVRELTLVIEPAGDARERIAAITGTLSGAAGTLDFATDTHGKPSDVALTFTKVTEGTNTGKWTATVRLLGIAGERQTLAGTIVFAGGNPQPMTLESDLSASLADFNTDKKTPLTLGGTIAGTPAEAGVSATIDDWNTVTGNPVEAI